MKSTGMVRKIDELGRIVLPAEIRQSMDIQVKDALEIFTENERIILQKYQPSCIFCSNADNVVFFNGKRICRTCLEQLKSQFWSIVCSLIPKYDNGALCIALRLCKGLFFVRLINAKRATIDNFFEKNYCDCSFLKKVFSFS